MTRASHSKGPGMESKVGVGRRGNLLEYGFIHTLKDMVSGQFGFLWRAAT